MLPELTARQRKVLSFIASQRRRRGYSPTIREIAEHLDVISSNGANDHLRALERKGCLRRASFTARGLVLTPVGRRVLRSAEGETAPASIFPACPICAERVRLEGGPADDEPVYGEYFEGSCDTCGAELHFSAVGPTTQRRSA